jgi:hypothetical protein
VAQSRLKNRAVSSAPRGFAHHRTGRFVVGKRASG